MLGVSMRAIMKARGTGIVLLLSAWMCVLGLITMQPDQAEGAQLQGKYLKLKEPSTHTRGKVKMTEFADFFCPHCHMFDLSAVPMLQEKFGDKVEITMVGYPVIRGMMPTPFLMYEQATMMGKGPEMKRTLFRTIHQDRILILDPTIRRSLVREVGLDPVEFEKGLTSGKPGRAFVKGKQWGDRIEINWTPTVLLDGNIKVEGDAMTAENLQTVIQSILDSDTKR